jgi:hypothetical protein
MQLLHLRSIMASFCASLVRSGHSAGPVAFAAASAAAGLSHPPPLRRAGAAGEGRGSGQSAGHAAAKGARRCQAPPSRQRRCSSPAAERKCRTLGPLASARRVALVTPVPRGARSANQRETGGGRGAPLALLLPPPARATAPVDGSQLPVIDEPRVARTGPVLPMKDILGMMDVFVCNANEHALDGDYMISFQR